MADDEEISQTALVGIRCSLADLQLIQNVLIDITVTVSRDYGILTTGVFPDISLDATKEFGHTVQQLKNITMNLKQKTGWVPHQSTWKSKKPKKRKRTYPHKISNKKENFDDESSPDDSCVQINSLEENYNHENNSYSSVKRLRDNSLQETRQTHGTYPETAIDNSDIPIVIKTEPADDYTFGSNSCTDQQPYSEINPTGKVQQPENVLEDIWADPGDSQVIGQSTPISPITATSSQQYHPQIQEPQNPTLSSRLHGDECTSTPVSEVPENVRQELCNVTKMLPGVQNQTVKIEEPDYSSISCQSIGLFQSSDLANVTSRLSSEYDKQNHQGKGRKVYQCPICPKILTTPRNLREHVKRHTGERPFKCSQCDKSFQYMFCLTRHQRAIH